MSQSYAIPMCRDTRAHLSVRTRGLRDTFQPNESVIIPGIVSCVCVCVCASAISHAVRRLHSAAMLTIFDGTSSTSPLHTTMHIHSHNGFFLWRAMHMCRRNENINDHLSTLCGIMVARDALLVARAIPLFSHFIVLRFQLPQIRFNKTLESRARTIPDSEKNEFLVVATYSTVAVSNRTTDRLNLTRGWPFVESELIRTYFGLKKSH